MAKIQLSDKIFNEFEIATDIPPKISYKHSNINKKLILEFLSKFKVNDTKKYKFENYDFAIRFKNLFKRNTDKSEFKISIREDYIFVKRLK